MLTRSMYRRKRIFSEKGNNSDLLLQIPKTVPDTRGILIYCCRSMASNEMLICWNELFDMKMAKLDERACQTLV